jgi:uracil-DNA glycosylase family 4
MEWPGALPTFKSIEALDKAIIKCTACPRLVEWRQEISVIKRKSYADHDYWGKPVPGFGDPKASIIIVGLAPGAHGANRTGRIFTGDSSGDFLYSSLYRNQLAKIPTSTSIDDGQELFGTRILCAVRCAPPDNKPSIDEKAQCAPFMKSEIELLAPTAKVFVALGAFAWSGLISTFTEMGYAIPSPKPKFAHGSIFEVQALGGKSYKVIGSYHPSQQNTFTGKLTPMMLDSIFKVAKKA